MPIEVNNQTYYRTVDVCRIVGISRSTLFRWFKDGVFKEAEYRDRRGWRLFTEEEVSRLNKEFNQMNKTGTGVT